MKDPVKVSLVNIDSGEEIEVLANPTELTEARKVGWSKITVPGLSHRPAHYTGSENAALRVSFWIDAHVAREKGGSFDVEGFANFCRAFTVPRIQGGEIAGEPPRLLFVWSVLSMICRVESLDLSFTSFDEDGGPLQYTAAFTLSEARDTRISSQQMRTAGGLA